MLSSDIMMCGYRVKTAVRCMIPKTDRLHFLRVLGLPTDSIKEHEGDLFCLIERNLHIFSSAVWDMIVLIIMGHDLAEIEG